MGSSVFDIFIIVGLSALLVSTDRAMREPQDVKRATETGSTFFCICTFILLDNPSPWQPSDLLNFYAYGKGSHVCIPSSGNY